MTAAANPRVGALLTYCLTLGAMMAGFHVVAARAGGIDLASLVVLALAAATIAAATVILRKPLTGAPYAFFVFHVMSYVIVAGSVSLHAFVADWEGARGGGLAWMIGLWSVGLLVHAFASLARHGFADADL
ncbi:hypothetical protein [Microbacterium testaceum]|uniref:hypothetical protein n=1 Tax=Microbacterium testaceum TaxID=2033 RepID=UPI000ACDB929|nr:hypothetical protein [Microbacterium testaceum]